MIMKNAFPQPDFARAAWLNLNGTWDFSFDAPIYDKKIEVPYPWGSPLSGISESKNGTGYYRRVVHWDPNSDRIFLCFGAVDYTCSVKVNGNDVGGHTGGYIRFDCDVTDAWNRGGANVIEVEATDTAGRNQTYGKQGYGDARGIWQTVWLEARPSAYIASFAVETKLDGDVIYRINCVGAADGTIVSADFGAAKSEAMVKDGCAEIVMKINNPKLWSPETPYLYEGTLTLGGDVVSTYFGIREIGTGKFGRNNRNYITLNGKPYYINGVLDQSFNPQGFFTLPSDDDCKEEILRLKRIGINMARIHIKAEEPLKLYWADKLGLLIMEDIPCFWGEPVPDTRAQFEREMEEQIIRDRNHPSLFYWVVFNETWGLKTVLKDENGNEKREYLPDTAEWVVKCWKRAKELDPTRLVEDNSPCNRDHTMTDVNTWHFYSNGYERVKGVVDSFCNSSYVGSQSNYKDGYTMEDVPCINSECGNVWGIEGNAGDSDISWQYKYMMNEFRLHDILCGFVFTEFHDVINEFNGYYKIDNSDKDFGYDEYGMKLNDLHSQDYLGADFAPMTTVKPGEIVSLPLFGSSFTDDRHGKVLDIVWQASYTDPIDGETIISDYGTYSILWEGYGTFAAGVIRTVMPDTDGVVSVSFALCDNGEIIMRNCILFDVDGIRDDVLTIEPGAFCTAGFDTVIPAIQRSKLSGLGMGEMSAEIETASIPGFDRADNLRILLEASTRAPMTHDNPCEDNKDKIDMNYMLGYRCDPGANRNSFPQTDEIKHSGAIEILIDGVSCGVYDLPDSPADSRGALSHHYQEFDNYLDEAGSYGYLCDIRVPSRILLKLTGKEKFTLTLKTVSESGLSLFGRKCGRYGIGVVVKAE